MQPAHQRCAKRRFAGGEPKGVRGAAPGKNGSLESAQGALTETRRVWEALSSKTDSLTAPKETPARYLALAMRTPTSTSVCCRCGRGSGGAPTLFTGWSPLPPVAISVRCSGSTRRARSYTPLEVSLTVTSIISSNTEAPQIKAQTKGHAATPHSHTQLPSASLNSSQPGLLMPFLTSPQPPPQS